MKECKACYKQKHKRDFKKKYSSRCQHEECTVCDYCHYQIIKQAFSQMCHNDVHCPEQNCNVIFKHNTVKKRLLANKDTELLEKYEKFLLNRKLAKMKEFIWCAHGCGAGQLNEGRNTNNIVKCVGCENKTCFKHKTKWHEGMTCEEYDLMNNPDDRATKRWIEENCKNCPNPKCSAPIRKADGCDHMTCARCKYQFCWLCSANFNNIRQHGNHRHKSTCKYYAANPDLYADSASISDSEPELSSESEPEPELESESDSHSESESDSDSSLASLSSLASDSSLASLSSLTSESEDD